MEIWACPSKAAKMDKSWSLPLKQRLRKRNEDRTYGESSTMPQTPASAGSREPETKKQKVEYQAAHSAEEKACSLKSCGKIIDSRHQARVEVKVGMNGKSKDFLAKCTVRWHEVSGEAQFHGDCWSGVERDARARGRRVSGMSKEERDLVREASETAEWHDSEVEVDRAAARIAGLVKQSSYCIAFTGAGISTSAGIGDYRGKDGKWTEMDRAVAGGKEAILDEDEDEEDGVAYEKLRPTYTHEALAKLMEMSLLKHVISQNGDGLHGMSGIPPENISELHGNVFLELCENCGHRYIRQYYVMDDAASQYYEEMEEFGRASVVKPKYAKKCGLCGLNHRTGQRCEQVGCRGYLKDSIINFRDNLEEEVLSTAETHAGRADLCLSLGTTMQVTPACQLVEMGQKPLRLVIVNRQKTPLDHLALGTLPPPDDHSTLGVRVHGDTDHLMRAVMKHMMSEDDLLVWEGGRGERMRKYDCLRANPQ